MAEPVQARPFGVRFDEAIAYLEGKLPEVSLSSSSVTGPYHSKVFTVAGATSTDLVSDLHLALQKALREGQTITSFRKDFDAAVQEAGWSYKGKRGWRTQVIFSTNMRTAHMAGRWQQLVANADRRPFLQYRTAGDSKVRPQHRQWNNLVFPIGHSFWQTHYPPNGWGCRCAVRAYGQADVDEKGLQVQQAFDGKTRDVRNRDGELVDQVPVGIDPGWDHNVGQGWVAPELTLGAKLARLPLTLRGPMAEKTLTPAFQQAITQSWNAFREGVKASGKITGDAQVVGYLDGATLNGLARVAPELELESTSIAVVDKRTNHLVGGHKAASNPDKAWPAEWLDALPKELASYRAVLFDKLDQVLVVVPGGDLGTADRPRLGKIVLRPNVQTKEGPSLSVVSLGSAEIGTLVDRNRYEVLVGRLR